MGGLIVAVDAEPTMYRHDIEDAGRCVEKVRQCARGDVLTDSFGDIHRQDGRDEDLDPVIAVEPMKSKQREQGCARYCRSEEHTSELQSLMRISAAVFCLK